MSPCERIESDSWLPRVATERLAENPGASTTAETDLLLARPERLLPIAAARFVLCSGNRPRLLYGSAGSMHSDSAFA
jgi:hypothetical protein